MVVKVCIVHDTATVRFFTDQKKEIQPDGRLVGEIYAC